MTRKEQVEALLKTVRSEGDGFYSVESESLSGWRYLCHPKTLTSPARCDCEDQRYHRKQNPSYKCKHLLAVRLYLQTTRAKGTSVAKNNDAMERFLKAQEDKRQAAPRTLTLEDQLAQITQQIERGDRSQVTRARYERLYQQWSEQGDPPKGLAFIEA